MRLAIVVEGATEKNFVTRILKPHLQDRRVSALCNDMKGNVSMDRLIPRIRLLAYRYDCVTTMVDWFGFKKCAGKSAQDIEREMKTLAGVPENKFIPYVQRHEFEALLFADKSAIAARLRLNDSQKARLDGINTPPESINHDQPPSKRLGRICAKYKKPLDGLEIARRIGLLAMMRECPRFAEWVRTLESLGGKT